MRVGSYGPLCLYLRILTRLAAQMDRFIGLEASICSALEAVAKLTSKRFDYSGQVTEARVCRGGGSY